MYSDGDRQRDVNGQAIHALTKLESFLESLFGHYEFEMAHCGDPRNLVDATIPSAQPYALTA